MAGSRPDEVHGRHHVRGHAGRHVDFQVWRASSLDFRQGTQFASAAWQVLCSKLGIQQIFTTAYHPQANGIIECAHRQLKDTLRSRLAGARWSEHLPRVFLGLRAAPKEDSEVSSAELVFGSPLVLPSQLLIEAERPVSEFVEKLRATLLLATQPLTYAQAATALKNARYVYVRQGGVVKPLSPCTRAHTK
jgi:transposase InsO family protein